MTVTIRTHIERCIEISKTIGHSSFSFFKPSALGLKNLNHQICKACRRSNIAIESEIRANI